MRTTFLVVLWADVALNLFSAGIHVSRNRAAAAVITALLSAGMIVGLLCVGVAR